MLLKMTIEIAIAIPMMKTMMTTITIKAMTKTKLTWTTKNVIAVMITPREVHHIVFVSKDGHA